MAEIAEQAVAQAGPDPAAWLPVYLDNVRQSRRSTATAQGDHL